MLANETTSVFSFGKILPNFNLKNMISIYKGNLMEKKLPKFTRWEEFFFQIARFLW
jgi:hypothetical protein